jgi:CDP-glycerol glycerophosphotransferase
VHDGGAQRLGRGGGTTRAIIRGRPGRAVLAGSVRNLRTLPTFLRSLTRRRDPQTWLFGNVHGFRDSPRYLAEHVLHATSGIEPHWLAHSTDEAQQVAAAGLPVVLRGSREARDVERRAGVCFFSHGFRDLDLPQVAGALLVWLWHGKSLKRVGLDVSAAQARRRPLTVRVAARAVRWAQTRVYRLIGIFVASSEHDKLRFESAFAASPGKVQVLGSPRFDVIRGGPEYVRAVGGADLRAALGYERDDRIVLWLPTHRIEYGGDAAWLPPLDAATIEERLAGTTVKILAKPHPNADLEVFRERLAKHPRVRVLADAETDVNCLRRISDALISDYSSALFDYAILDRPIHFLAPDIEKYDDQRGMYEPYETLTGGDHRRDWPALLDDLREDLERGMDSVGARNARRVKEYCRHNLEPDACRRIVAAIIAANGATMAAA